MTAGWCARARAKTCRRRASLSPTHRGEDLRPADDLEVRRGFRCHRLRQQRLAIAGGPVQEDAARQSTPRGSAAVRTRRGPPARRPLVPPRLHSARSGRAVPVQGETDRHGQVPIPAGAGDAHGPGRIARSVAHRIATRRRHGPQSGCGRPSTARVIPRSVAVAPGLQVDPPHEAAAPRGRVGRRRLLASTGAPRSGPPRLSTARRCRSPLAGAATCRGPQRAGRTCRPHSARAPTAAPDTRTAGPPPNGAPLRAQCCSGQRWPATGARSAASRPVRGPRPGPDCGRRCRDNRATTAPVPPARRHAAGHAVRHARTVTASGRNTRGSRPRRWTRRRANTARIGAEIGSTRPTRVFERSGDRRTTPPATSTSLHRSSTISRFTTAGADGMV